ncbi:unnamed protein product, partial [Allacma fusca]
MFMMLRQSPQSVLKFRMNCRGELSDGKLLPVLVWIHGGSFLNGNGSFYTGTYLLDECVVLVTINYRFGALGFLTTEDNVIPGNLGLKDQVVALKWTKRNIRIPVISHIDDEQYIFPKFKLWLPGTEQYEFSKDMLELWTNFMRYGRTFGRLTQRVPWDK